MTEDQLATFMATEQVRAQLSHYTIRRYGKPDDVAAMALFFVPTLPPGLPAKPIRSMAAIVSRSKVRGVWSV
jgi:hypothetical protein